MLYRSWIKPGQVKIINTYGDSHWDSFEKSRQKHNSNICAETNKLVLRLDKLINADDETKKADLDKSLVEWTSDELVKLCPYCAKSFTFARRRHHCRLCGAIQCNACSQFLEYKAAYRLVRPAKLYTDLYDRIEDQLERKSVEDKPKIRTCEDCKRLLDKRVQLLEDHYSQPTFLTIYDKLRKSMAEADDLILSQSSLSSSGSRRETTLELKSRIQEFRQKIATMSARVKRLAEREPSDKQAYLLNAISQSVLCWLKESLDSKMTRVHGARQSQAGNLTGGWVPEAPTLSSPMRSAGAENENPLLIQIRNLEEYIKQARLADRYEEVSALEANKRDLEIEYFIQQDVTLTTTNLSLAEDEDDDDDDHDHDHDHDHDAVDEGKGATDAGTSAAQEEAR